MNRDQDDLNLLCFIPSWQALARGLSSDEPPSQTKTPPLSLLKHLSAGAIPRNWDIERSLNLKRMCSSWSISAL